MNRRDLLHTTLACPAAAMLSSSVSVAAGSNDEFEGIIDSNIHLFRWPFRRLPLDETPKLVEKLRSFGVTQAWAGSFESVFHRDLASANRRLVEECDRFPELVAIGAINPSLPGWERELRRCVEDFRMPGIRLYPGYHGYGLEDPRFSRLLSLSAEAGVFVQLAATLEDIRTQPALALAPDVDLDPLSKEMAKVPGVRVQLLNLRPRGSQLAALRKTPGLYFDTARADGTDGVASLLSATGADRVIFGTHAPFLIPEASLIRVHESALEPTALKAVLRENAIQIENSGAR